MANGQKPPEVGDEITVTQYEWVTPEKIEKYPEGTARRGVVNWVGATQFTYHCPDEHMNPTRFMLFASTDWKRKPL